MDEQYRALASALVQAQAAFQKNARGIGGLKPSAASSDSPSSTSSVTTASSLHPALMALGTHIRKEITALSLSFSGGNILPDAALMTLPKLVDGADKLAAVMVALASTSPGTCLWNQWQGSILTLIFGLNKLCLIFTDDLRAGHTSEETSNSTSLPPPYLLQTSTLWNHIDTQILTNSTSESHALAKLLKSHGERLNDAIENEYKDLLEEDEGVEMEGEDDFAAVDGEDEEWGDLQREFAGGDKLTEQEMTVVKNVQMLLRLALFLQRRITTQSLPLDPTPPSTVYLASSTKIMSSTDDLIANLYSPQEAEEVNQAVESLISNSQELCDVCLERMRAVAAQENMDLAEQMNNMAIVTDDGSAGDGQRNGAERTEMIKRRQKAETEIKWLTLWTAQMDKSLRSWREGRA